MPWGDDQDAGLLAFYQDWSGCVVRPPSCGAPSERRSSLDDATGLYAYACGEGADRAVVVLNLSGAARRTSSVPTAGLRIALATDDTVRRDGDSIALDPYAGMIALASKAYDTGAGRGPRRALGWTFAAGPRSRLTGGHDARRTHVAARRVRVVVVGWLLATRWSDQVAHLRLTFFRPWRGDPSAPRRTGGRRRPMALDPTTFVDRGRGWAGTDDPSAFHPRRTPGPSRLVQRPGPPHRLRLRQASLEESPLGRVRGESEGPSVGRRGLRAAAEPAQQVGPRRVQVGIAVERLRRRRGRPSARGRPPGPSAIATATARLSSTTGDGSRRPRAA